jgi:quercetin dioxygenase-like cupin family protein
MATATATNAYWFIQNLAVVKVPGEQTENAWSMLELTGPRGDMPPLHVHHRDDEAFYVLDGEVTLFVGDREIRLAAGECAVAPRGIPHVYRVDSEEARMLVIASPAGLERFVAEASVPAEEPTLPPGPPAVSPERLAEIAAGYGIEILGPPGTLP